jgi:hypothetical protein
LHRDVAQSPLATVLGGQRASLPPSFDLNAEPIAPAKSIRLVRFSPRVEVI